MPDAPWYGWDGGDLLLYVRVQPRASRDQLAGVRDGRLRVHLTAPPADGKANAGLQRLLARLCGVGRTRVTIESGHHAREKRVRIESPSRLPDGVGPE